MSAYSPANPESVFTYGAPQLKFGTGAADEIGYDLSRTGPAASWWSPTPAWRRPGSRSGWPTR